MTLSSIYVIVCLSASRICLYTSVSVAWWHTLPVFRGVFSVGVFSFFFDFFRDSVTRSGRPAGEPSDVVVG